MNVETLAFSREEAEKLHRKYKEHRAYAKPIDLEIERIAALVAKGKQVIAGIGSVQMAGVNMKGLPNLAIGRADQPWVRYIPGHPRTGGVMVSGMESDNPRAAHGRRHVIPSGSFGMTPPASWAFNAIMPHIPPDIRPKRGIENYTILWEAVWEPAPPVDPILMRQIGKSDLYLVVAQWDLTPIERMVMQTSINRRRRP